MQRNDHEAALAVAVMTLIDRGHRRISARLDLTRLQILGAVAADGPIRPGDLAASLGLTKSAVSRHLTALQDAGQVQVAADPHDSRTFLVDVTSSGSADVAATLAAGSSQFTRAIADWSDAEVDDARRVVERLLAAWESADAPDRTAATQTGGPRWMRRRTDTTEEQS